MHARSVWWLYVAVLAATAVTYYRLAPGMTYHFEDTGLSGAVSRSVNYLNYPVAIAAIALVWSCCRGRWAVLATLLCAVAFVPGVVSQDDLEAGWANVPAAVGVCLAAWLSFTSWPGPPLRLSRVRMLALLLLAVWSIPWLIACVGLYAEDLGPLGDLIRSREPTPGKPDLASVHLGLHEGLFGSMLAATALILSARRRSTALSLYMAVMLVYGVMVSAQDGWNEQVVKRGWTSQGLPSVLTPKLSAAWAALIAAALCVQRFWFRRARP
jgi:hypothetical protein